MSSSKGVRLTLLVLITSLIRFEQFASPLGVAGRNLNLDFQANQSRLGGLIDTVQKTFYPLVLQEVLDHLRLERIAQRVHRYQITAFHGTPFARNKTTTPSLLMLSKPFSKNPAACVSIRFALASVDCPCYASAPPTRSNNLKWSSTMTIRTRGIVIVGLVAALLVPACQLMKLSYPEALDDEVAHLTDDNCYPHSMSGGLAHPRSDLLEVFNNTRCLKMLDDIEKLPAVERDIQCREIFDSMFQKHVQAVRKIIRHEESPSAPENKVSIRATMLATCFSMLATAKFASTSALKSQFARLDDFQEEIEQRVPKEDANVASFGRGLRSLLREYCVPDYSALLNILCMHAAALRKEEISIKVNEICANYPKWDVPYDIWSVARFDNSPNLTKSPQKDLFGWPDEWRGSAALPDEIVKQRRQVLEMLREVIFDAK